LSTAAILGFLVSVVSASPIIRPADIPSLAPFGVSQYARPSDLKCEPLREGMPDATGQYLCQALPRPNPDYEQYILAFVRDAGVCNLVAITPYTQDDDEGTATRKLFTRITARMTGELGEPDEKVDAAQTPAAGSDLLFKRSVIAEERQIFNQWNDLRGQFQDLQSASIALVGDQDYGLAIYSAYRFTGNDDCMRRLEQTSGLSTDP